MHAGNGDGADELLLSDGHRAQHNQLPWASQAFHVVSHVDLGVRQCHELLISSTETTLSSKMPATGTLIDLQPAFNTQVSQWPPSRQVGRNLVL